jgi:hypothetical protein
VRYLFALLSLAAWSCREIQPVEQVPEVVSGYLVSGSVTTESGVPLDSVEVRLWYNFDPSDLGPIDTAHVVVTDPTKVVDVMVTTPGGDFVRQLYLNYRQPGPVPRFQWDFYDSHGVFAPSGAYIVRYAFDTVVVKLERRIIQGTPTAVSDASGHFTIGMDRLPIGDRFDIYTVQNQYAGPYVVLPRIDLEFRKGSLFGAATIDLQLNRITTAAFTVR